jgi:DNA mismatch endonuclease, patch repair protein
MIDVVDRITRSRMMAGIRGKDTKPELDLRRALHRGGLRYRLHVAGLPGRPDIVLPKYSAVIEVRGCFWHRHKACRFCTRPASNPHFWKSKFGETIKRDRRNLEALRKLGWKVAIVWECSIKDKGAEAVAGKIAAWLQTGRSFKEFSSRNAKAESRRISRKKKMAR